MPRKKPIHKILEAKSIAVVGASSNPTKIGHAILKNLLISGFEGKLYAVNPHSKEILGVKCYPSVLDIKGRVDSAIIAVPASVVKDVVKQCAKKGIKGLIVISGGFKEVGNVKEEEELAKICDKHNMAMIGPNCLGVVNMNKHIDSIFLPTYKMKRPKLGDISFITQSGAVGSVILDLLGESDLGVSKFISYGNAAHVDESNLLAYLREDDQTKVIAMYIEGIKNGRRFYEELKKTTKVKPVIVLKAGRGSLASKAAKSHTGSLAGDYKIFSSMLRQAGAIEARNMEELFDLAKIFLQPLPQGKRILVVTNGGGEGVLTVDAIEEDKLELSELSKKTIGKLKRKFPKHVVIGNPLDLTGDADAERYRVALENVVNEKGIDAIIVITLFQTAGLSSEVVEDIMAISNTTDKTLVVVASGGEYTRTLMKILESYGIPTYESPSDAVNAIAKAHWYYQKRKN